MQRLNPCSILHLTVQNVRTEVWIQRLPISLPTRESHGLKFGLEDCSRLYKVTMAGGKHRSKDCTCHSLSRVGWVLVCRLEYCYSRLRKNHTDILPKKRHTTCVHHSIIQPCSMCDLRALPNHAASSSYITQT